jgi:hypothetical protein
MESNKNLLSQNKIFPFTVILITVFIVISISAWSANKNQPTADATGLPAHPAVGSQFLRPEERDFLVLLSQHIKNAPVAEQQLNSIIDKLNNSAKLDQGDYLFLTNLSQRLNNPKISSTLMQIAQRHHI